MALFSRGKKEQGPDLVQKLEGYLADGRLVEDQLDDVDGRLETDGQQVLAAVLEKFGDADFVEERDGQLRGQRLFLHLGAVERCPEQKEIHKLLKKFQTPRPAFEVNKQIRELLTDRWERLQGGQRLHKPSRNLLA